MHVTGLHRPLRKDDRPLDGGSGKKKENNCESLEVGRRVLRIREKYAAKKSVDEKCAGDKFVSEKCMGESLWVKRIWLNSLG